MKKTNTRRSLVMSVLALVVCIAMLVGSTYAWFTDSVSSVNNIIKSGNLDVTLDYYDADAKAFNPVVETTKLFDENALWEPGYTEVVYLKVANAGNLALKYQLSVNVFNEVAGTNVYDETFKLSDHLVFKAIDIDEATVGTYTREQAMTAAGNVMGLKTYTSESKALVKQGDADYIALVIYMPTTVGNEANYKTGTVAPMIEMGVNLLATQFTSESDSFNNQYDKDATYINPWDGSVGTLPEEADGVITIKTPGELAAFANAVNGTSATTYSLKASTGNSFAGKKVVLGADINLGNIPWTPIGACDGPAYFQGTFDGQGHTIYGLNVDNSSDEYMYSTSGLFGWIDAAAATIKNVNIDGATVKGSHWVGALVGYMTGEVTNCTVVNSTVLGVNVNSKANGDKIGGLVGFLNKGAIKNCTVSDCTVSGNRDVGGLAGSVVTSATVTNNTVKNTVVTHITDKDYASSGAIVSGRTGFVPDDTNKVENVTVNKGKMVANGVVETGTRTYQVTSKEGLLNVNDIIAESSTGEGVGIKVTLLTDVDLAGETWKPIDKMWIDFDGNGHTISNLKTEAWKAGFFGYLGGGSIKNLTLENVDVTGAQAGAFAGSIEGKIDNCVLKGNNTITWKEKHQYDDPSAAVETWSGIGAITGITQPSTVNATIAEGATVTLDYNGMTTEASYVDELTGYIGTNKGTVVNNGTINIVKTVSDATDLKASLTKNYKDITLKLEDSVDFNLSTELTLGGADTETITIEGNGADTVLNLASTYRNYFNSNATVTLKNLKVTNAQTGTHFYDYSTHFNCDVVAENVTFGKPILLGAGKNASFKNIAISLDKSITYYAMFIMAGANVEIDGADITSQRAIKIADEDVASPAKTVLSVKNAKFNSDKKAAILVTSTAGADITLSNVDISNVKADTVNAVWNDEARKDAYGKITVTGGTLAQE